MPVIIDDKVRWEAGVKPPLSDHWTVFPYTLCSLDINFSSLLALTQFWRKLA